LALNSEMEISFIDLSDDLYYNHSHLLSQLPSDTVVSVITIADIVSTKSGADDNGTKVN